jgi:hypothetical protein
MDETKRRSGSFGSAVTAEASNESAKKLSLSEGSIVDKETSPLSNASLESQETSPAGTLKKPRKFKPRKYIAKKLKLRKSDKGSDQDQSQVESQSEQESIKTSSSVSSKLSEKLSSPKLQRFNFVKRFSSGKKSYRVSPLSDDGDESKEKLRSLSVSESSVLEESGPSNFVSQVDIPLTPSPSEPVTLESKKVELKITMAKYEKRATSPSAPERATVDKASFVTSRDIELPRASGEFFAKAPYVEQAKPISEEETFAAVVRDGMSVKSSAEEKPSEVEKYSILTTSLQTILSTAKDLEEFGARGGRDEKDLKFPELPDLKIREEGDREVEEPVVKFEVVGKKSSKPAEDLPESLEDSQEVPEKSTQREKSPVREDFLEAKSSRSFNTSTPIRAEVEEESSQPDESFSDDEMRKQKKSKIPIDQKRLSASFDASTAISTVHTQQKKSPYHVNLSTSSSEESFKSPDGKLSSGEIKFEVGTPVKNFPSPTGSTTVLSPIAIPEASNHDSNDDVFHSPKSEKSLQPESITRRKIAYVPQLTIYSPEEQELLKSNFAANADSFEQSSMQVDSSVFPVFDDSLVRTFPFFCVPNYENYVKEGNAAAKALNDY